MINYIWSGIIIISIIYGGINGNYKDMSQAFVDSGSEAVSMCIVMLGMLCMWSGLMEIAKEALIIKNITNKIMPFIDFLYPELKGENAAKEYIAMNMVVNILGVSQAATQSGIVAMKELKRISTKPDVATNSMCVFVIMNISSLQLIPVTMIAYRQKYGSVNPQAIIGPSILATLVSTLAALIFCKIMINRR